MAANMMEILKQIQRDLADQKAYMKNLHIVNKNLNEKLNFVEEKISDLPQVLVTIGRLEEQVKKNNMLLFGNDETECNFDDRTVVPYITHTGDNYTDHLAESSEKCMENAEKPQLQNACKVSLKEETELNSEENKNNDNFQRTFKYKDEVGELITNEIREIKKMIKEFIETKHTSVEEAATCCKHDAAAITPSYLNTDHISKLNDKLNNIAKVYQSDMREIKKIINDAVAINQKTIEETSKKLVKKETEDQINQLNAELKRIVDTTQSGSREIEGLIKDSVATSKMALLEGTEFRRQETALRETNQSAMREIKELIKDSVAASKMAILEGTELRKQETALRETNQSVMREIKDFIKDLANQVPVEGRKKVVKISPTYFSADQISKLNSELKRIAETYQETNIPIVEVTPGSADEHPVMKLLREGVYYESIYLHTETKRLVKLGRDGLKRSDVIDMLTDYPDLSLNDVVKEWLVAAERWKAFHSNWISHRPWILKSGIYEQLI